MRLAFISDVHANSEALKALEHLWSQVDRIYCLGDLIGYYCQVNEVIDCLRSLHATCILGNHDHFLLHGCPPDASPAVKFGIDYANRVISASARNWLSTLPLVWGGIIDGLSLMAVHGSPWDPLRDYLYADNPRLNELDCFKYDLIAFGQTHRAYRRLNRRPLLLNPGSVGQSRDRRAHACAMLLDTSSMAVEIIERPFDSDLVINLAKHNGAGNWIGKHLGLRE